MFKKCNLKLKNQKKNGCNIYLGSSFNEHDDASLSVFGLKTSIFRNNITKQLVAVSTKIAHTECLESNGVSGFEQFWLWCLHVKDWFDLNL